MTANLLYGTPLGLLVILVGGILSYLISNRRIADSYLGPSGALPSPPSIDHNDAQDVDEDATERETRQS